MSRTCRARVLDARGSTVASRCAEALMQSLRAARVGVGVIAEKAHPPAYRASMRSGGPFAVVAIADGCAARRELAHRLLPGARIYPDHHTMLAAEASNLDYVDIATPPCDH